MQTDKAFGPPSVEVNQAGDLALVSVPVNGDFAAKAAMDAVKRVRNEYVPSLFSGSGARVLVSGESALILDVLNMASDYTPIVFGLVLGLSFLLFLLLFRSIVIPVSAIIMNLFSVGATYGLLVLVFQHGFLNELLGFQQVETIEFWVPILLFAILFGLSMDYHVFLLSRIRERFDETGDNREAVYFGVRHTGRIITGAALIMVAVFACLRHGTDGPAPADGLRAVGGCDHRRDDCADRARAGDDDAAGAVELVSAEVAGMAAGHPSGVEQAPSLAGDERWFGGYRRPRCRAFAWSAADGLSREDAS